MEDELKIYTWYVNSHGWWKFCSCARSVKEARLQEEVSMRKLGWYDHWKWLLDYINEHEPDEVDTALGWSIIQ